MMGQTFWALFDDLNPCGCFAIDNISYLFWFYTELWLLALWILIILWYNLEIFNERQSITFLGTNTSFTFKMSVD